MSAPKKGKKPAKSKKAAKKSRTRKPSGPQLVVRPLEPSDWEAVHDIQTRSMPGVPPWTRDEFQQHLKTFPEGQIGIDVDGELVATSSSLILHRDEIDSDHTFRGISGNYRLDNHDPEGDILYGIDIAVRSKHRGKRLARRLYDARKDLAAELNLTGMMLAGRMPRYHHHATELSPEQFVEAVVSKRLRDPTINAQLANGFSVVDIIHDYLPEDQESCGHAVLMEWHNPDHRPIHKGRRRIIDDVRVASVQYAMRPVESFEEFAKQCEFFVETASEYRCDFICFPELLTNQLLTLIESDGNPLHTARALSSFTGQYQDLFRDLALRYNLNIIGGSHLVVEGEHLYNDAFLFRRDGSMDSQRKLHITPSEARWWGVSAGDEVRTFDTDCGPIAILICYDIEFPELARIVRGQGARMIFVPFNTDIRHSYLRVRTCAHARCVENNVYCVLSGPVGNLPLVDGSDIHYAQSCVLSPCDIPFSRDGIGAEATPNVETILIHEVDMSLLRYTLNEGSVRTWLDRRHDLYDVRYKGDVVE